MALLHEAEMGHARPLDGSVSLGKVRAKTIHSPGVAEMALFREPLAAAGRSQAALAVRTGAGLVAGVCGSVNRVVQAAQGRVSYLSPSSQVASPSKTCPIDLECILLKSRKFDTSRGSQPCGSRSIR
jgi:hypothetical protein